MAANTAGSVSTGKGTAVQTAARGKTHPKRTLTTKDLIVFGMIFMVPIAL